MQWVRKCKTGEFILKSDYTYCINKKENCIHRRGCRHWIGNYTDDEVKELYTESRFVSEVDESKCIPNYKDAECENAFNFLDRFRYSNGKPFALGFTNKG